MDGLTTEHLHQDYQPQRPRDEKSDDAVQPQPKQKQKTVSEARRLQNRISSKKYREKRKQKLHTLNTLEQLLEETENSNRDEPVESVSSVRPEGDDIVGVNSALPLFMEAPGLHAEDISIDSLGNAQSSDTDLYNNSWFQPAHNPFTTSKSFGSGIIQQTQPSGGTSSCVDEPSDKVDISDGTRTIAPISAAKFASCVQSLSYAERRQVYNFSVESGTSVLDLFCGGIEAAFGDLTLQREEKGPRYLCEYVRPNFSKVVTQGIPMFLANMPTKRYGMLHRPRYGADIRMNNIHFKPIYFLAAAYTNCRILGYDFNDFLDECSISPICSDEAGGTEVQAITKRFSNLPKDLRPTPMQIQKPHHLYIDLFPFPDFREKIITSAYTDPPILDEEQLCIDLLGNGMICHGPANGGVGAPWDKRNWEPQTWFLEKYWFLVGDKDDDMWSAAEWWQRMRGDD